MVLKCIVLLSEQRKSLRGQSLLPAVTDTVPHGSRAGLPVSQVLTLTAGHFLQEHLGRCLCGFLRGLCDDPGEQKEIQNRLKGQSQDSVKSQTSNDETLG